MTSLAPRGTAPRSTARRRTALLAVLLAPALAACGFSAQTDQIYQAAQGVNDRSSDIWILNAVVVAAKDGSGTFAGSFDNQTDSAQSLSNVTGDDVTPGGNGVKIPADDLVNLGEPDASGGPQLSLTGTGIEVGRFVKLTFTFSGGAVVTVNVPVVSTDASVGREFANVPLPSPTPTDTATEAATDGAAG